MNKTIKIILIVVLIVGIVLISLVKKPLIEPVTNLSFEKINIIGETAGSGVFDPSIEYNEDGTIGWLAYSPVKNWPEDVNTAIARTTDNGKTWEKIIEVNPSIPGTVVDNGVIINGMWRHEVSTLLHDPDDPGKEWKLYWHRYFAKPPYLSEEKDRMLQYGWIAYKYASDPSGPWSEEVPLFGAGQFPSEPYSAEIDLNTFHDDLNYVVAYSEPGSLYNDGTIYLALQTFKLESSKLKTSVILISSNDHGNTWKYIGVIIDDNDAADFDSLFFDAPSLAEENGRVFLLVSRVNEKTILRYGTYVFEFEDITTAKLKRDDKHELIAYKYLPPILDGGQEGQGDYDQHNIYGGIIISEANAKNSPPLAIYNTKEKII